MSARHAQDGWLRLVIDADGISDYRDTREHHHRADLPGRLLSLTSMALVGFVVVSSAIGVSASRPQVTAERDRLLQRVVAAQRTTASIEQGYQVARQALAATEAAVRPDLDGALAARVDTISLAAGFTPVRGPGLVLSLDDAVRPTFSGTTDLGRVIDRDVQHAVNGLWRAGAEAISIDGVRLTSRTSIRNAGQAILVDYRPVTTPIVIRALGNSGAMLRRLRELPEWSELTALRDRYRLRWSVRASRELTLPAGTSAMPRLAQSGDAS